MEIVGLEGTVGMSGGCLAPMSLDLTFKILETMVMVEVDDKWFTREQGRIEGAQIISHERYLIFARRMRELISASPVQPTFASSEMGAGVKLPTPEGLVEGGGHEMVEGPPPGPIINEIEKFAEEIFGKADLEEPTHDLQIYVEERKAPAKKSEKGVVAVVIAIGTLPFLVPITIFVVVFWWIGQQSVSSLGDDCVTGGECENHLCNITDTGSFWIFGAEGYCTKNCQPGYSNVCPSHMSCEYTTFNQSSGTGAVHKYVQYRGYYCVPKR